MLEQFLAELELDLRRMLKYKLSGIIWPFLVAPISWIAELILMGKYVDKVSFYGTFIPYLYVIFTGIAIMDVFLSVVPEILYTVAKNPRKIVIIDLKQWLSAISLSNSIRWIIRILVIFFPLYLRYSLPLKLLKFSILIIFLTLPSIIGIGLILSFFTFKFRKDADPIWWSISSIAWSVFPVYYSLMIFEENTRFVLEIAFPPFAIIEELRKLAIIGIFNVEILELSIITSFLYLILGFIVFNISLKMTKRSGILFLE